MYRCTISCILLVTVFAFPSRVCGQFESLMRMLPGDANAIVLLNLEKIHASDYAKKAGWDVDDYRHVHTHAFVFPPKSKYVVLGANLDMSSDAVNALWETVLIRMESGTRPDFDQWIDTKRGKQIVVSGYPAITTDQGNVVIELGDNIWAGSFPNNHQRLSRWANRIRKKQAGEVSDYLKQAHRYASREGADTEIIMAIDLENAIEATQIGEVLPGLKSLKGQKYDRNRLAQMLAGVRGITLGVRLTENPYGRLKIDFGEDPAELAAFGKPMFIEILSMIGAYISDFEDWEPGVDGNSFYITGKISRNGIRRLGSLIEPPRIESNQVESDSERLAKSGMSKEAFASKQHLEAITDLVGDLKGKKYSAQTRGQAAMWYERYSRKITRLPVLNVDDQILAFNQRVADLLLQAAYAKRMSIAQGRAVENRNRTGSYVCRGRYCYYTNRHGRGTVAGAYSQGAQTIKQIFEEIDNLSLKLRSEMARKYKVDF